MLHINTRQGLGQAELALGVSCGNSRLRWMVNRQKGCILIHGRDWRGRRRRVALAMERAGDPRNPGKPLENGLLAIFKDGFSVENPQVFMQTFDAPSLALYVLLEWQGLCRGTFSGNWSCRRMRILEKKKNPYFSVSFSSLKRASFLRARAFFILEKIECLLWLFLKSFTASSRLKSLPNFCFSSSQYLIR